MKAKAIFSALMAGVMVLFASCNKEPEVVKVTGVTLDETSLLLTTGQSQKLVATVAPAAAANKDVTWSSSNPSVASVSDKGEVSALTAGNATITVTTAEGGFTAKCEVTVMAAMVHVSGVKLDKTALTILLSDKPVQLVATVEPANATTKDVTWTSSNPDVATVDNGTVTPVKVGKTTITVTTKDGGKTATCEVTVDASEFKVTFEVNGGDPIEEKVVNKGDKLATITPTRSTGLDEGLYEGIVDPDSGSATFDAWYTDPAFTTKFDFNTPITADITLYAKWITGMTPIDVSEQEGTTNLHKALAYLKALELTDAKDFTFIVTEDIIVTSGDNSFRLWNNKVSLYLVGQKELRTIEMKSARTTLFTVDPGKLYVGKNINLKSAGTVLYANATVKDYQKEDGTMDVAPGTESHIFMLEGSKISGCETSQNLVIVQASQGHFYLQGGEIVDNSITAGANDGNTSCIYLNWGGMTMTAGKIAGNKVYSPFKTSPTDPAKAAVTKISGAIYAPSKRWFKVIDKTGGVIENNEAHYNTEVEEGVYQYIGQQVLLVTSTTAGSEKTWVIDANIDAATSFNSNDNTVAPWVEK